MGVEQSIMHDVWITLRCNVAMLLRSGPLGQKSMLTLRLYIFPWLSSQQVGIEYYSN
ncbi:hypothetical protein BDV41DRAFT_529566 [Aspergillus transmontanensis]|uniref:Uncharacterized protein n=1 Tax=Aspergillus transmontanensis TaxID=1034304 RepID=A0A5N6W550_9EURO|nr:hypothetical protein BDV41DRAFT_529566 [Aspergillus transmontanensis]